MARPPQALGESDIEYEQRCPTRKMDENEAYKFYCEQHGLTPLQEVHIHILLAQLGVQTPANFDRVARFIALYPQ